MTDLEVVTSLHSESTASLDRNAGTMDTGECDLAID